MTGNPQLHGNELVLVVRARTEEYSGAAVPFSSLELGQMGKQSSKNHLRLVGSTNGHLSTARVDVFEGQLSWEL